MTIETSYKYNNIICLYLNLDFRTDRKESIEKELEHTKNLFPSRRVSGIYGKELDLKKYIRDKTLTPNPRWDGHPFTRGQLGCMLSHLKTWKEFLKTDKKYKYLLLLEDDVVINKSYFDKMFPLVMKNIDKLDFDWLYLGRQSLGHKGFYKGSVCKGIFYTPTKCGSGNHSYILSRKGAENMIKYLEIPKKEFFNNNIFKFPSWPMDVLDRHKKFYNRYMRKSLKIFSVIPINFHKKREYSSLTKIHSKSREFLFYAKNWNDSDTRRC